MLEFLIYVFERERYDHMLKLNMKVEILWQQSPVCAVWSGQIRYQTLKAV